MANVTTWADGFGVWHASVPLSPLDMLINEPHKARCREAMAARKAIREELEARYAPRYDPTTLHVTRERVTNHGTVIYKEV